MSPRATDYGMRAPAPAPSPIALPQHHQEEDHRRDGQHGRRNKHKKPLSSGFKAIVWTSPPPVGLPSKAPVATSSQGRESPRAAPSPKTRASSTQQDHHIRRTRSDVAPIGDDPRNWRSSSGGSGGAGGRRSPRTYEPRPSPQPARNYQSEPSSVGGSSAAARPEAEVEVWRRQQRLSYPPAKVTTKAELSERERERKRAIGKASSEDFGDQLAGRALQHLPPPAAVEGTGMDSSTSQSLPHGFPVHSRRPSSTDAYGNVVMERSLSDTSVVTASDFGGTKSNKPIILSSQMSDEDAIKELVALLAKGKGLPVVKHATGMGGGKSRKLLRLHQQGDWHLALCGMLPPYFKTKIPVRDVDRVEAKWCCVVVHARGRSPLRLEVDSFATADTLRIGLMAASRIKAPSPPQPAMSSESKQQQQQQNQQQQQQQAAAGAFPAQQDEGSQAPPLDAEGLSLSSVRPGHSSSQIYDPDAALSVAALLAKEMEEERLLALQEGGGDGGVWASARHPCRPEVSPPGEQQRAGPKPLLKRSASMNSMVSSRMGAESTAPAVDPVTNRRSLPRGYGGPMIAPGAGGGEELVVVDAKASLRRLYDAIEGRGMVAIKRNPNGKGRSRVMVRSRIKDNSIGWAHVLPPFTRKFVNVKELTGAQRSSRVVTVKFKTREPVMFETDKLTDALILEQGFVSLARLQKTEANHA